MSQNLSSAAVVIGTLRVYHYFCKQNQSGGIRVHIGPSLHTGTEKKCTGYGILKQRL